MINDWVFLKIKFYARYLIKISRVEIMRPGLEPIRSNHVKEMHVYSSKFEYIFNTPSSIMTGCYNPGYTSSPHGPSDGLVHSTEFS